MRRRAWVDVALAALGLLFGSTSLAYPLTLDAGVNYYVAREWLLRGALPYRDSFDHRAPGIYLVHAACIALFGEHAWGIRVAELGAVLAVGLLAGRVATPRGERPVPGARGAAVLAVAVFYYGFFDYWGTAQCELWCALGVLLALWAVAQASTTRRAAILSGVASGAALLLKPPAAPLVLIVVGVLLVARARREPSARRAALSLVAFVAAAAAPALLVLVYFAARGGLPAMADVLLGANAYYVAHEPADFTLGVALRSLGAAWRFFAPFDTLIALTLVLGGGWAVLTRRATRSRYALAAALLAAAIVTTVVQRKFYIYHWILLVPAIAVLAATATRDLTARASRPRAALSLFAVAVAPLAFYASAGGPFDVWARTSRAVVAWAAGDADRDHLLGSLSKLERFYAYRLDYADRDRVGRWLRDRTAPSDPILVRGLAAEIYAIAGRRASSRFFWTLFLTLPTRAYHREQWLAEDREAIERDPPRFVVAYADIHDGPDSAEWFAPLGYVPCERLAGFLILARAGAPGGACDPRGSALLDAPSRL